MIKHLRFVFMAVMAMMVGNAMAEDIIWQEDFSSFKANDVPAGGDYNYVCTGTTKVMDEKLAGGTAPELLIQKKNSFTATVPLNGKSGEITLSYKANYDRVTVTTTTNGVTLGEKSGSGTYVYPVTVTAGIESVTLVFNNTTSSNVRVDDIKLYQGTAKKPADLSWGKASTSVTLGGDYANIPTLQNPNNLDVTCQSSKPEVCSVTNVGVITVEGAGETDISATFAGSDEYEAQSVSIKITVKEAIDDNAKGQKNNPYVMTDDDFLTLVNSLNVEGNPKSTTIYVKGFIVNIDEVNTEFGNAIIKIAAVKGDYDAEMKLKAYHCKYLEKQKFTSDAQIKKDDDVVLCGQIQWYGTDNSREPQLVSGYIYSLNGETSGVNAIKAEMEQGKVYNLQGQRVLNAQKGLYIVGGKKVVLK